MLAKWWGRILFLALIGFFIFGISSAYSGYFAQPLEKEVMNIRKDAHSLVSNKNTHRHHHHHGFFMGGGFGAGK